MKYKSQPEANETLAKLLKDSTPMAYSGQVPDNDEVFALQPPITNYHEDGTVETIVAGQRNNFAMANERIIPVGRIVVLADSFPESRSPGGGDFTSRVVGTVNSGKVFEELAPTRYGNVMIFGDVRGPFLSSGNEKLDAKERAQGLGILRYRAGQAVLSHLGIELPKEPKKSLLERLGIKKPQVDNQVPSTQADTSMQPT